MQYLLICPCNPSRILEASGDLPPNVAAKWKEALEMGAGTSNFAGNCKMYFFRDDGMCTAFILLLSAYLAK